MARLPGDRFLIQQIGDKVVLFRDYTEEEIVSFNPSDRDAVAEAQGRIQVNLTLTEDEKAFAHFWSGYFYAYAVNEGTG